MTLQQPRFTLQRLQRSGERRPPNEKEGRFLAILVPNLAETIFPMDDEAT
ncbi:MAG: hypothetical protein ACKO6E_04930 [Planctomycetota bacterium]